MPRKGNIAERNAGGATNRSGVRHGPREIRNMLSFMCTLLHVTKVNPYDLCRVGELGEVLAGQDQCGKPDAMNGSPV